MTRDGQLKHLQVFWQDIEQWIPLFYNNELTYVLGWYDHMISYIDQGKFDQHYAYRLKNEPWSRYNTRYGLVVSVAGLKSELLALLSLREVYSCANLIAEDKKVQTVNKVDVTFQKPNWSRAYTGQVKTRCITKRIRVYDEDLVGNADRLIFVDSRSNKHTVAWVDRRELLRNISSKRDRWGNIETSLISSLNGTVYTPKF